MRWLPILLIFLLAAPALCRATPPTAAVLKEEINRGEYDKSVEQLRRERELFPYNEGLRNDLATVYALIAQRELKLGHYPEAAAYFGQAEEILPERSDFMLMRGVALYFGKQYDAARSELGRAEESCTALLFEGRIAYDTGDLQEALRAWRRALELEPQNEMAQKFLTKLEKELPVETRMDKGYSSMFDVSFDAELPSGLSAEVLDALESAYNKVGGDFGLFPNRRIPVLLYLKSDYRVITNGPDWSGGLYDGKIRLPLGNVAKMTPQLRGVLFHEYTHVLVAELTGGNVPTWLNEGLAEYQGRREFNPPLSFLAPAGKEGKLMGLATLSGPFAGFGGSDAGLAYQQSYSMVKYLVASYGWQAVRDVLKYLGEKDSVEEAFRKALANWALDLPGFVEQWKKSLSSDHETMKQ
ncbi:peptidase MA family metallohydrolase [Geomesophilobacter sediminis]|uniref:Tetratricopeptide repeat protein n=1 Tax=Geomesophilobacter sediminis TaxID=2798584 RepID=A0A8J7J948_9BACT|nr:tetratricopeptide repeat protein [Geomesophilobacter sediminis]MBJ6726311.1 tetratricopeptide repeat protein [Geomesophilobacter sediminis]